MSKLDRVVKESDKFLDMIKGRVPSKCPYCGREPEVSQGKRTGNWRIRCGPFGKTLKGHVLISPQRKTRTGAIKAWNARKVR